MDKLENLEKLVAAAVPSAAGTRCYVGIKKNGVHPATYDFFAYASGPGVVGEVGPCRAASAELAAQALKAAWGKARRAYEVAQVLSECRRLSDGTLDLDQQAVLENELLHCHWSVFEAKAGSARKSAQALAPSYSQAA